MDEIEALCEDGRLIKVEQSYPRPRGAEAFEPRSLYVTPEINEFLMSDHSLAPAASADFTDFVFGEPFEVSLHSEHEFYCRMSRLDEAREEVWEMRIWDIEPQLRFYGRFAKRNIFIILYGPVEKSRFFRRRIRHNPIKRTCISTWQSIFSFDPLTGGDEINAYLSNVDPA
ncbi:MAG: hypothetical protein ABSB13_03735 [Candidatus Binatus sp.]|jgi:hypothetical protein|uniref:hypothetical protein n=1 Tax=Candidatus Binatus sp. TaxID=2811406 RepID=UPI003D09FDB4